MFASNIFEAKVSEIYIFRLCFETLNKNAYLRRIFEAKVSGISSVITLKGSNFQTRMYIFEEHILGERE